jgi:hypothetical protein
MDLNNLTLSRCLRLEALAEIENGELGVSLRSWLNGRDRRINTGASLTAGMLSWPPMALARHLLAAGHFCFCHLAIWQTSQRRRDRPQK